MDEISKALQKILDDPEDLSLLPQLIAKAQELEKKVAEFPVIEEKYHERINKLQELNRSYLAQIPIPGQEGKEGKEEKEEKVTFEQAKGELLNAMKNVGGMK